MKKVNKIPLKQEIFKNESSLMTIFRSKVPLLTDIFEEHHHTAFEITMVLSGEGIYATKSTEFTFKSGDIFFFSTDEFHWIKKLNQNSEFINIHFEPRFIWSDNFGFSNKDLIRIFFNRKKKPLNKIVFESDSAETIKNLIFKMENEISLKKNEYDTMLKIHLINILVEMFRFFEDNLTQTDISYSSQSLRYMEDALNYIDEHLENELTLEMLSDVAHMSKTYFCSQFRKLNGISPWEYITIKRVERAITYIKTTDMTKSEIAFKCGYTNTANFYYAFKRVTGKAPGDYNKSTDVLL